MSSQKVAQYAVPSDELATLRTAFERAGFRVKNADVMAADLSVRYRSETGDEAEMRRIVTAVAPSARRLPNDAIPAMELEEYRADRP